MQFTEALQEYALLVAQHSKGGMQDKPGKFVYTLVLAVQR